MRIETAEPDLMEEIRQAVGARALFGERRGTTLFGRRIAATADGGEGPERPVVLSFRPTGAFLLTIGVGGLETARGFDGSTAWSQTDRDVVRRQSLGGRQHLLADGWLRTHLWLTPGYDRFAVSLDESASTDEEIALRLTQSGEPLQATVRIDRSTRRPASFSLTRLGRTRVVTFDGWTEENGAWLPSRMAESLDGAPLHVDVFDRRGAGTPRTLSPPRSRPNDTVFDDASPGGAAGAPGRSGALGAAGRIDPGGRSYARVLLNGEREAWMLLDTGFGSHALSGAVADELGLAVVGRASLTGVGGGESVAWRSAAALAIGPLTIARPRFVELDTPFLSEQAGFTVDGVLGAPLFERAVVVLDDPRSAIEVYDPRRFRGRGLDWQPIVRDGTSPCVRGRVRTEDGETPELWFRLDTGSDDTLTVARWAVQRFDLAGEQAGLGTRSLAGPFGIVRGWRKIAIAIELAGANYRRTEITLLRQDGPGPLSDPWVAGNAGTGSLRGRRVVLDLSRERIAIGESQ
ncbi:MAG: retropepsin-like aspartic protease [Planctomycetota bacterium]